MKDPKRFDSKLNEVSSGVPLCNRCLALYQDSPKPTKISVNHYWFLNKTFLRDHLQKALLGTKSLLEM